MAKIAFRQAAVSRAVKGVMALGLTVAEVVVEKDGRIRVLTAPSAQPTNAAEDVERRMREAFGA